ncbi:hypothetical protein MW887_010280 [Aspergillus wentii]|nr:hypothetical protein MW887_010280 [Aspergillus wentii]
MLASFKNTFTPSTIPSALLVMGKFSTMIHVLHILPENGTIERLGFTTPSSTTFRRGGTTEQGREQIGTVTLHVGNGETTDSLMTLRYEPC